MLRFLFFSSQHCWKSLWESSVNTFFPPIPPHSPCTLCQPRAAATYLPFVYGQEWRRNLFVELFCYSFERAQAVVGLAEFWLFFLPSKKSHLFSSWDHLQLRISLARPCYSGEFACSLFFNNPLTHRRWTSDDIHFVCVFSLFRSRRRRERKYFPFLMPRLWGV